MPDGILYEGEYHTIATHMEGTFIISVSLSSLSMENALLEEYFPGFRDYRTAEDDMATFFFRGYPDQEEIIGILQ